MNFRKTDNIFRGYPNEIKYSTQRIISKDRKKLVPSLSCRNYFHKPGLNHFFLKTNIFNFGKFKKTKEPIIDFKKIQIKNSSFNIFQRNDVDIVRNLNFDYLSQINDNIILRENLVNSLQNKAEDDEEKMDESENNETEQIKLPKLDNIKNIKNINGINKYKSYEMIQNHKRKIQIEMSEQLQKELISRLKNLRGETHIKKKEKNEIFDKIKNIEHELEEIEAENYYSKEKYKRQIDDIVKKTTEERKEEIIKSKAQAKLEAKKRKFIRQGTFMELFKSQPKESSQANSSKTNLINIPQKQNSNITDNNLISNNETTNIKNETNINSNISNNEPNKSSNKKSLEMFKINMLQTQRKIEFEKFQNSQKEKAFNLKNNLKNLENHLTILNIELENYKKEEKEIISKLMIFYKELLFKGKNVKKDGLVWIIKAIWNLGENVPMSFMPDFLDVDSIEYLFKLAHKQLEIEYFTKKIIEMKLSLKKDISNKYDISKLDKSGRLEGEENNNQKFFYKSKLYYNVQKRSEGIVSENKKDVYKDLVKEFADKNIDLELTNSPEVNKINNVKKLVEKIKNEIMELKRNEIKRIFKCFIENNYEEKFNTNIETVLSALIGTDAKDTEMNKYNVVKKNYISKLKKIRFFDHEHIRKILSK